MRLQLNLVLQVIAVTACGVLTGWALSRFAHTAADTTATDGKYEFGTTLEASSVPVEARLDPGQKLALIVGINRSSQVPVYLGILYKKYRDQGLKVLAVLPQDSPKGLGLLAGDAGTPWVLDSDSRFQGFLRFVSNHHHDAVLMYDDSYKVKFHLLGNPENDVLRQLVEKYLIGEITYRPSQLLADSLLGRRVEGLECAVDHGPARRVFVVFPPGCSSCELNSFREPLKKARHSPWASRSPDAKWTLVFVNGRDPGTLAHAKDLGFGERDVCGVREDLLLDPYQTRKSPATMPLLLLTDDDGIVKDVQDLMTVSVGGAK